MKKLLLLVGFAALSLTAAAQNEAVWGVRAGMNIANLTMSGSGIKASLDSRISYQAGVAYQQPLARQIPLYLETGLYISDKGTKTSGLFDDSNLKVKMNLLYLQIPVAVSWHFNMKNISLQPYVGAYYAYGINGKAKMDGAKINLFKSSAADGVEYDQAFKRSDVGLRFGLGMAVKKHYYVGLSYDLGLVDINKEMVQGMKTKTGALQVTLGYNF